MEGKERKQKRGKEEDKKEEEEEKKRKRKKQRRKEEKAHGLRGFSEMNQNIVSFRKLLLTFPNS